MIDRLNDRQKSQQYWQHWRWWTDTDRETDRQRNCGLPRVVNVAHIQTERHRQEGSCFLTPSQPWWLYQGKRRRQTDRAQELCERRGGRLGFLPLIVRMVFVDVKWRWTNSLSGRHTHKLKTHKTADNAEMCVFVCVCACMCVCVWVCARACMCRSLSLSLLHIISSTTVKGKYFLCSYHWNI